MSPNARIPIWSRRWGNSPVATWPVRARYSIRLIARPLSGEGKPGELVESQYLTRRC